MASAAPPSKPVAEKPEKKKSGWLSDFEFESGILRVRKTGATARIDAGVLCEVAVWLSYYIVLRVMALMRKTWRSPHRSIAFVPDVPRPWYLIRSAALWAGITIISDPEAADVVCFFEDATLSAPLAAPVAKVALNFGCTDISKSRVARVFAEVFGYPLAIDPRTFNGVAVEKSETNSLHDGRLIDCPCEPVAGKSYQRFIDTSDGREIQDLRTPCVGGRPVLVWEKSRAEELRFSVHNHSVTRRAPADVFSGTEIAAIGRFCDAMYLDWGGLDILRCRLDGRIYIVDVNKTDVGPVIALPLLERLRSVSILGSALLRIIQ